MPVDDEGNCFRSGFAPAQGSVPRRIFGGSPSFCGVSFGSVCYRERDHQPTRLDPSNFQSAPKHATSIPRERERERQKGKSVSTRVTEQEGEEEEGARKNQKKRTATMNVPCFPLPSLSRGCPSLLALYFLARNNDSSRRQTNPFL